jgi:GT2 family glycosyltransferase
MIDAQQPSVTVTFVAWMRQEMLQKGLESVLALPDDAIEIIVVDNSPSDHSIYEWLQKAYPMVKAIKTFSPLPLPMVRNILVASARGKYVVFHDDDSRFVGQTDLASAIKYLDENNDVACLAFRQGNELGERNPLFDGEAICPTYNFIACAVMFRRSDYFKAGGYFEQFPLYGEEMILSLGFFGIGKQIHYFPYVEVIHEQIRQGRDSDPERRYALADMVMTPGAMLLRAPFPDVLLWYPLSLIWAAAKVAMVKRRPLVAMHGLLSAVLWIPAFIRARRAIPISEFRRWIRTRYQSRQGTQERIRDQVQTAH